MTILDEIVANKRKELEHLKKQMPFTSLIEKFKARAAFEKRPFIELFKDAGSSVVIAEIKPRSPSAGALIQGSPFEVADMYAKSRADAISVLTDASYFGGSLELLTDVRTRVPQAVLRKDFIVDEYQIYEAALAGADAYLLIAGILPAEELTALIALGKSLGLDAFIETHSAEDIRKAVAAKAEIIGINNRNLERMETDLKTTEELIGLVPEGIPIVSESGISSGDTVRHLHALGVRGVLVGTSILQSSDPLKKIAELKAGFEDLP